MQEKRRTGRLAVTTNIDDFWAINLEGKELDYLTHEMERRLSDEIFSALMSLQSEVVVSPVTRFSRGLSKYGGRTIGIRTDILLTDWGAAKIGDYVAGTAKVLGTGECLIVPSKYGEMEFEKDSIGWRRVS